MGAVLPEVYTVVDIARAAGVPEARVAGLLARGEIDSVLALLPPDARPAPELDRFIPHDEAVRVVRALREGRPVGRGSRVGSLLPAPTGARGGALPLVLSTSLHAAAVAAVLILGSLCFARADMRADAPPSRPTHIVFLVEPGPGGGGGGGGARRDVVPPTVRLAGTKDARTPLPARRLPPPTRPPHDTPPRPIEARPLPSVAAPVAAAPADTQDREGVPEPAPEPAADTRGSGVGTGTGSGRGSGTGEGDGAGIAAGTGSGTGGGPYRPGSGVTPPRLLREVRADYTDAARRRGITGEVLLEIVVEAGGEVGTVRVLRGLDPGLDGRAVEAVRQWRFAPARLHGSPVPVIVEVSVEFALR